MQEKEWNKKYLTSSAYRTYRGVPLYRDVIIKTKSGKLITGEFKSVSENSNGDILNIYCCSGKWENISINDIDEINLYIDEEDDIDMSIQKYIKELEEIKNQQKELAEKMELLQKKIEEEDTKKKWWIPKHDEKYYTITETGINQYDWTDDPFDRICVDKVNCFKTKEEAERIAFEQLLYRKLKRFGFENNEEEIDWKSRENKYTIIYNNFNNIGLTVEIYISFQNFGQISFSSREIAEQAIEEFRDDLIRYFTSDK